MPGYALRKNRAVPAKPMAARAEELRYQGLCNLCGAIGEFRGTARRAREQFPCPNCRFSLRYRDQAAAILHHAAFGRHLDMAAFAASEECGRLAILEAALRGPFVELLRGRANYTQTYLFEDVPLGASRDGVLCQDLERTTFDGEQFDLVITSDVMEHVADWRAAIAEIGRLLKPGGAHVFSVPLFWPFKARTTQRAKLVDGELAHLLPPAYHVSGTREKVLVFSEFGMDLLDAHAEAGLEARLFNGHSFLDGLHRFPTVIAAKPARVRRG